MTAPNGNITIHLESGSPEETIRLGAELALWLKPGMVVALEGELGAGKTCLTRGIVCGLGLDESAVSSPTFVLMHEYDRLSPKNQGTSASPIDAVIHIDAYRMTGPDDLATLGFEEMLSDARALVVIEWPERIRQSLPEDRIEIVLTHTGGSARGLTIICRGSKLNQDQEWVEGIQRLAGPHESHQIRAEQPSRCPICRKPTRKDDETFPFCSPRCRMVDLNRWFKGAYKVSRPVEKGDDEAG